MHQRSYFCDECGAGRGGHKRGCSQRAPWPRLLLLITIIASAALFGAAVVALIWLVAELR